MGLAEDLKALQDLRDKGEMTPGAYAAARDAAINKHAAPSGSFRLGHFIGTRLIPLAILALILWVIVSYNHGSRETRREFAAAVHASVTVTDVVENVPANSWKALALTLPYGGTVDINLQVVSGNPLDVFLTTPDQLDTMKKEDWANVRVFSEYNATKSRSYRRTGQLGMGNYYLVVRDTSLGILSHSATDISLKVQLNP